ncbi:alpha-amylase family glycosyl hydrolase [Kiritimatiella glycovorans]|uniref:Trehalose synthase/amylase TreS n=1 Tax=Kiritimatiella glycovorans TaxID=1307763 RepID=A0A0G3EIS3_9BACT|nr:alpha-amylase family glycosyl hydrolase [Kiritimatiella glycovorans]AKJ64735.1 Trehalose synthase/amylase TreS [Kiritimatiella glycovorans]
MSAATDQNSVAGIPEWLRSAVIYGVFPPSFRDANGDGIGDLPGIVEKLDYFTELGVDVLWLNPVFDSPFEDGGYDVSDFYRVAPRYGTNEDLERLFAEAGRRGIRVLLDFVAGHTSIRHPWFQQSARAEPTPYSNWYIWTDHIFAPCGEKFIGGLSPRSGRYHANFFYFQPSLNYGYAHPRESWQLPVDHPDVLAMKEEMRRVMTFWLDKGAAGFRVDLASTLIKDEMGGEALKEYWRDVREWIDRAYPDRALVAEWSSPEDAIDAGFHVDFALHCNGDAYNSLFRMETGTNVLPGAGNSYFRREGKGDITPFMEWFETHARGMGGRGFLSIPSGNHDLPRLSYRRNPSEQKVALAFVLTMPGVPSLYYGDEIGLRYQPDLPSKEGAYLRTGSRTPMQWDPSPNAGFSTADPADLYLPIDPASDRPTVEGQRDDPDSIWRLVQALLKLRREHRCLRADGGFAPLYAEPHAYPFVFERTAEQERMIVALNPSAEPARAGFTWPEDRATPTAIEIGTAPEIFRDGPRLILDLAPVSFCVLEALPPSPRLHPRA